MTLDNSRLVTLSARLYGLLLLAYPTRFRRAFGPEMAQVFRDDIHGTFRERGAAGLAGLWFLVVLDLIKTAFAEHIWEIFHMPMHKLSRWSGVAAAIGGPLFVYVLLQGDPTDSVAMFLPALALWAIAFLGLYGRLPAAGQPANRIMLAVTLFGVLLIAAGFLALSLTGSEYGWNALIWGFFGSMAGIAGMGIIALSHRALGRWRFVPIALAGAMLGFILTGREGDTINNIPQMTFLILFALCWLLLGIALWTGAEEVAGPALPA